MLPTALIVEVKTTKLWKLAIGLHCISRIVLLFYDRKQSETFALLFVKKKIFFLFYSPSKSKEKPTLRDCQGQA